MFCLNFKVSVLILSSILTYCQGKDYCRDDLCPRGYAHIACINNKGTFGSKCPASAAVMKIDTSAKDSLVKDHNLFRQKWASGKGTAPRKACKMATMGWDEDLANLAELNVRSCAMEHDLCRNTEQYPQSGQNLFWLRTIRYVGQQSPLELFKQAFGEWTKEESLITAEDLEKLASMQRVQKIGHSTILLNEKNFKVGCAIVTHPKLKRTRYYYVACNYAANNMLEQGVYTKCAQPGSKCPKGISTQYPPLCA